MAQNCPPCSAQEQQRQDRPASVSFTRLTEVPPPRCTKSPEVRADPCPSAAPFQKASLRHPKENKRRPCWPQPDTAQLSWGSRGRTPGSERQSNPVPDSSSCSQSVPLTTCHTRAPASPGSASPQQKPCIGDTNLQPQPNGYFHSHETRNVPPSHHFLLSIICTTEGGSAPHLGCRGQTGRGSPSWAVGSLLLGEKGPLGSGSRTTEVWALKNTGPQLSSDLSIFVPQAGMEQWGAQAPVPRKQPGAKVQMWAWCRQSRNPGPAPSGLSVKGQQATAPL